ncbi:MAG: ATP-binding protein [Sphingobacteriales bacterium]|nr:MAG: ATP-binding protein [Sphingobacteriales bacterium]
MVTRKQITQWLTEGEGPYQDFKQYITSPPKIARAIVAFANSRGGRFLVGVGDKGHVVGVDPDGEIYFLEQAASQYCNPPIEISYDDIEINGKTLLIAYVEESSQKPHYAIDKNGQQQIYVRIADKCVTPSPLIIEALMSGELNGLKRSSLYEQRKTELRQYLTENPSITPADYAQFWNTSERNARRSLLDFMFDGVVILQNDNAFVAAD